MKKPGSIHARKLLWLACGLVILGISLFLYHPFLLDLEGKPQCHKIVDGAFQQWMAEGRNRDSSPTNAYPNVRGVGKDSLEASLDGMAGQIDWPKDYNYVPGLQEHDPGELVLMYFNRPTRWVWHGTEPTIFGRKAWIIVPVDFAEGPRERSGPGELSERVSTDEFKRRLRATLEFLKKNQRPYWETVAAEHTRFLETLEKQDR